MALPTLVATGTLAAAVGPITAALPAGISFNDVLIFQVASVPSGPTITIANAAGGTWDYVAGFSGSEAGPGIRGSWLWSRYNGTQTAPTTTDTGALQVGRITAFRGCVTTGFPINAQAGLAPTFAETSSSLPSIPTTSADCLILDCIVSEGPDADGTGIFSAWTNAALTTPTEVFDVSSSVGTGAAIAMQIGGFHPAGATGATSVTHANLRVCYKKIALAPAVLSSLRFDKNARCQPVINGVTRFARGIYDAELPQFNDFVAFVATRNYARYDFDFVIHPQAGTFGNPLRFANALQPLGMFHWATGNFFGNFTIAPEDFIPATSGYDLYNNNTYTIAPQPTAPFRDSWLANPGAAGNYIADEPAYVPTGWYHTDNASGHWSTENYGTERMTNGTFATNLSGWTATGGAVWDASGRARLPVGAQLSQIVTGLSVTVQPSDAYRLSCTLIADTGGQRPICTIISAGVVIYDSSVNPTNFNGKENFPRTPGSGTLEIRFNAGTGPGFVDDVSLFAVGGDPAPVPTTRSVDDMEMLHTYCKSVLPDMPTFGTFLNDNITQWVDWSQRDIADWLGCDIYTVGQSPELDPANTGVMTSTYGYMHFPVCEAAALARYYCPPYGRVPQVVLGVLKFGGSSRFITLSEIWSHMVIGVAELRGVGAIVWWALGNQDGGLDQRPFQAYTANGTQTVFACPANFLEEVVDVEVKYNNVVQSQSTYTVQNVQPQATTPLVRQGFFWVLQNTPTVTMLTAPAAGTSVVVTTWRNPQTRRNAIKDLLDSMTALLKELEPIMIQPSNPALLTMNSTGQASFLAWRIPYCQLLGAGPIGNRPVWLEGARIRYSVEAGLLQQTPPVYSSSLHIMDGQAVFGNVRTTCWESGNTGIVAAFNVHPDAQPSVTFEWHSTISRVEVLGENREIPVNAGRRWVDTFGGASSLRQGPFNQGHLYRLTVGSPTGGPFSLTLDPGVYGVTGATTVLSQLAGPTLVAFVYRV